MGRLFGAYQYSGSRIARTAGAAFVQIPCKETQKDDCSYQKVFIIFSICVVTL